MEKEIVLVSDVGGTNARFGLFVNGEMTEREDFQYDDFKDKPFHSYGEIVQFYLAKHPNIKPSIVVVGTAGNIVDDKVESASNLTIIPDMDELKTLYPDLKSTKLVNDFILQALAIPQLKEDEYIQLVPEGRNIKVRKPSAKGKKGVSGPGTGLGNSQIKRKKVTDAWDYSASEAGQKKVPELFNTEEYSKIKAHLESKTQGPLTIEKWVSGRAIENIYEALLEVYVEEKPVQKLKAREITQLADEQTTKRDNCRGLGRFEKQPFFAIKAHDYFFSFLASHVYDMITIHLLDEVYLVGGVFADERIHKMMKREDSVFFKMLYEEMPKSMQETVKKVPIYASTKRDIAFKGLITLAEQEIAEVKAIEAKQKAKENSDIVRALMALAAVAENRPRLAGRLMVKLGKKVAENPQNALDLAHKINQSIQKG